MGKMPSLKQSLFIIIRLAIVLYLATAIAGYLNSRNYNDYFSKTLVRIHAEKTMGVDAGELARLLMQKDYANLQKVLDRNYHIFALVITDCKSLQEHCSTQNILFMTDPALIWKKGLTTTQLLTYPYTVLFKPSASVMDLLRSKEPAAPSGEILGRVYAISTIPTFEEDYRHWLHDPLRDNELWRAYLTTMAGCLLGGLIVWIVIELFLRIRRMERRTAEMREAALIREADTFLNQLEEKEAQLADQERRAGEQHAAYIGRIRDLELKLHHVVEYRDIADGIIHELEEENRHQSDRFRKELELVSRQKQGLQKEMDNYRKASGKGKLEASRSLESAITPQFDTVFEQRIHTALLESPKCRAGEWRLLHQFDVAAGKGMSQTTDCIVISKDFLVVLEAKYYAGCIVASGDTENTGWICRSGGNEAAVRSNWGVNPYQQVRQYTMGLMKLVQRGEWKQPVFGVVVFADGADISGVGEKIGKYYRVTTADRLVGTLNGIEAEARRENMHSKRPSPEQMEAVISGRKIS